MGNMRVKSKAKNRMFIAVWQNTELCDYVVKISIHLSELQITVEQSVIGQCLTKICPISDNILPAVGL